MKISTNRIYAGTHWKSRKEFKGKVLDLAESYCQPADRIKNYPVSIEYNFTFATKPLDSTNCSYMAKMFEDSLISLGILDDDSPKYVSKSIIKVKVIHPEKNKRELDLLEITIKKNAD